MRAIQLNEKKGQNTFCTWRFKPLVLKELGDFIFQWVARFHLTADPRLSSVSNSLHCFSKDEKLLSCLIAHLVRPFAVDVWQAAVRAQPMGLGLEGHTGSANSSSRSFEAHLLLHVPFPGLSSLQVGLGGVSSVLIRQHRPLRFFLWHIPWHRHCASPHLCIGQLSQNHSGREGPLRSLRTTLTDLHPVMQTHGHIQTFLEHLQEWCPYTARKVRISLAFSKSIFLVLRQKWAQDPFLNLSFWLMRDFLSAVTMCPLAGHFQLLLLEADPVAKCLKFLGNFQTKFIHNTFMPVCSRTRMVFPLKWVFSLPHCVCPEQFSNMRGTKRGGMYLLSGTSGKVVAGLWNSLSADAVTPQWFFWDCSAVPNGLRLHSAWWHPIPVPSQRDPCAADKNSEYMQISEPWH